MQINGLDLSFDLILTTSIQATFSFGAVHAATRPGRLQRILRFLVGIVLHLRFRQCGLFQQGVHAPMDVNLGICHNLCECLYFCMMSIFFHACF
jgi:hypothetical protein